MDVKLVDSNSNEVNVSIKDGDIGTLYIIQHELLKNQETDFAGVIMKHPLTNEIWMRVNSKKNPISQISAATDSAIAAVDNLKKHAGSKIKWINKMKFCPKCDVRLKKSSSNSALSCPKCDYSKAQGSEIQNNTSEEEPNSDFLVLDENEGKT